MVRDGREAEERFMEDILGVLLRGDVGTKSELHRAKVRLAGKHSLGRIPADAEVLGRIPPEFRDELLPLLRTKAVRELSGVVTVAAMSSPERCPHGRCLYCPGGVERGSPQSYTGSEPAALRGSNYSYDSYREVRGRLEQLAVCGHPVDKVDLIIMGGTFPARPPEYQMAFVKGCYDALNEGPGPAPGPLHFPAIRPQPPAPLHSPPAAPSSRPDREEGGRRAPAGCPAPSSRPNREEGRARSARPDATSSIPLHISAQRPLHSQPPAPSSLTNREEGRARSARPESMTDALRAAIDLNETAPCRCIGLTIETRPDWCREEHIDRMLSFGTTRVEMGVQSLSDDALARMQRGHGLEETVAATRLSRDAGLKVGYHMMPGFPFVEREEELGHYRRLFEDELLKPDLLKLYPTLVMEGTGLHELWRRGLYLPLTTEEAVEFLAEVKSRLPPWVRVQRIQRDIPAQLIGEGVKKSNLRQLVRRRMEERGLSCGCIRCREVGHLGLKMDHLEDPTFNDTRYEASGGTEAFLSLDTPGGGLVGYLRLRRPSELAHRPEVQGARSALVRELRVLGELVPLDHRPGERWQHRGFGMRLLGEAERISSEEWKAERLLVNSGAGARGYYRRIGYDLFGPYMAKTL